MYALGEHEVAAAFGAETERRGLLGRLRVRKVEVPPAAQAFVFLRDEAGIAAAERDEKGKVLPQGKEVLLVSRGAFPYEFVFPAVKTDEAGHAWDMVLSGQFSIARPEQFVARMGRGTLAAGARLKAESVVALGIGHLEEPVLDLLTAKSLEDLRDARAIPARWWPSHLAEWLEPFGIEWTVPRDPEWRSAQADAARFEEERRRAKAERREREQEEREARVAAEAAEAEYREQLAQIEHDRQLKDEERQQRIGLLTHEHSLKRTELDTTLQQTQWARDEAELEHQARMAELQGRKKEGETSQRIRDELVERNRRAHQQQASQHGEMLDLLKQIDDRLRSGILSPDPAQSYAVAERLMSPEYGLTVGQLRALGHDTTLQEFFVAMHEAAAEDQALRLQMRDLRPISRDVVAHRPGDPPGGTVEVDVLRVGDSLRMELVTGQGGHAALLNFGTSGSIWLIAPNAFCGLADTRVEAGKTYAIPGSALLPWEPFERAGFDDLQEGGPIGREHMIAIVSREPLVDGPLAEPPQGDNPFRQLSQADVEVLLDRLADMPEDHWHAAELAFDVVPG